MEYEIEYSKNGEVIFTYPFKLTQKGHAAEALRTANLLLNSTPDHINIFDDDVSFRFRRKT